jgi:hypothetical protein
MKNCTYVIYDHAEDAFVRIGSFGDAVLEFHLKDATFFDSIDKAEEYITANHREYWEVLQLLMTTPIGR